MSRIPFLFTYVLATFISLFFLGAGCQESTVTLKLKPETGIYSVSQKSSQDPFKIEFMMVNETGKPVNLKVMSCSYYSHWITDHQKVELMSWNCDKNVFEKKWVNPGESYQGVLSIRILKPQPNENINFKLGFVQETTVYWSQPISIKVMP